MFASITERKMGVGIFFEVFMAPVSVGRNYGEVIIYLGRPTLRVIMVATRYLMIGGCRVVVIRV